MDPVNVTDYCGRVTEHMATAANGEPVEVTKRGRDYVTTVKTVQLRRLEGANAALQGFLRLAARGADCWEYQERANDLVDLIESGALRLPDDAMQITRIEPDLERAAP